MINILDLVSFLAKYNIVMLYWYSYENLPTLNSLIQVFFFTKAFKLIQLIQHEYLIKIQNRL